MQTKAAVDDNPIKNWLKTSPLAAPMTVARMMMAGYRGYPTSWDNEDEQTRGILNALNTRGYYVYEGYYTPEQCAAMRNEIDTVIEDNKDSVSFDDLIGDARLFGAEKVSEMIDQFNKDEYFQKLSDLYHGEHAPAPFTMAARLVPNDINKDKDHGWHRDSLRRQFKTIVYLDDVTEENGPFQYITESQHMSSIFFDTMSGQIPYMSSAITAQSVKRLTDKDPSRLHTVTGKAGTVVIADTTGIHRGSTIKSGHRYALTNYYMFQDLIGPYMNDYFGPLAYRESAANS